jgi:hypothetical protein
MVTQHQVSAQFDLVAFDADGAPVLAVKVDARPGYAAEARRWLQHQAPAVGAPYGLVVDREAVRLFDLGAGLDAAPLLEVPLRELLAEYAHGLPAEQVSSQYLILLADTWLRNVVRPLPSSSAPGMARMRELGLVARLDEGETVMKWRSFF